MSFTDEMMDRLNSFGEKIVEVYQNVMSYFSSLELYQTIAWSVIGVGVVLVVVGLVLI